MLKQFDSLLPPAALDQPDIAATKLLTTVLMRVNFIPGIRQRLGWRGMRECSNGGMSVKIAGHEGVFGLAFAGSEQLERGSHATFDLHYFPAPDEESLEQYSVAAGVEALSEGYLDRVREFTQYETLRTLFHIAQMGVTFHPNGTTIELSLQADERLTLISAVGVLVTKDNSQIQIVPPGGIDQELPAYALALPFYNNLSASLSFCLKTPPSALKRLSSAAVKYIYHENNHVLQQPDPTAKKINFQLSWGEPARQESADAENAWNTELSWKAPDERPAEYADASWWEDKVPGARYSLDKNTMGITERPKLIVLTGFLGSGKTSFLNHFIEYQAERNAFVAIVQNEIGAIGLDSHLLGQHYAVTEMDEGCICCTLAGNLKVALAEIASNYQPDFVVVETTGLANPANFLHEIYELESQLDFCSITTVIDATQGIPTIQKYGVAQEQLILADVILLNKTNDIAADELATLVADIKNLNPLATIHSGNHGDFSVPGLYGINFTGNTRLDQSLKQADKMKHHTHAANNISSILVELKSSLAKDLFLSKANQLPDTVLRIKGVVQFNGNNERFYYQYVPGSHSLTPVDNEAPDENFLVMIGENIEKTAEPLLALTTN